MGWSGGSCTLARLLPPVFGITQGQCAEAFLSAGHLVSKETDVSIDIRACMYEVYLSEGPSSPAALKVHRVTRELPACHGFTL